MDCIVKWNPRTESARQWFDYTVENSYYEEPREGKRVWVIDVQHQSFRNSYGYRIRRVMRVIKRTIDKKGQSLLAPDITMEGWQSSLNEADQQIIDLYSDHSASEQFHSELKTDLDIVRLP